MKTKNWLMPCLEKKKTHKLYTHFFQTHINKVEIVSYYNFSFTKESITPFFLMYPHVGTYYTFSFSCFVYFSIIWKNCYKCLNKLMENN